MIPEISIKDYVYDLPDGRIAKYPLENRDESKLLCYKAGKIETHSFKEIPELLPENSLMIFNNTKVVPARMHFKRETGAHIEVFCMDPVDPPEYVTIFAATERCRWHCVLGNAQRWKTDALSLYNPDNDPRINELELKAILIERDGQTGIVEFSWKGDITFSNVLDLAGNVPIPPYLNRDTESIDLERYQTTYARFKGSVAAPTAGLHFTQKQINEISAKGIQEDNVCLHVGAGTFLPVKSTNVSEHPMHREPFVVKAELLRRILNNPSKSIIAVGTTSVRTLESLYYVGVSCIEKGRPEDVEQWAPYSREYSYSREEALQAILDFLDINGLSELKIGTRIIIIPGFKFRFVDVLVTNFHQPESTLLLLVSAFVDGDWRSIYDYALANDFRFLSYGDSSLLFKH